MPFFVKYCLRARTTYTAILMVAILGVAPRFTAAAQTPEGNPPPVQFSPEADAVSATLTTTMAGVPSAKIKIQPVDQSTLTTEGYDDTAADSAVKSVFGMEAYNISTIVDHTDDNNSKAFDSVTSNPRSGQGILLGGLIAWSSNGVSLACSPDAHISGQVNCVSSLATEGLLIHGVPIAPNSLTAGASLPVTGPVDDFQCQRLTGTESFSGTLVDQEIQITDNGTPAPSIKEIGLHLVGDSTCTSDGAIASTLFRTHYDLAIGGITIAQHEVVGDGAINIVIAE